MAALLSIPSIASIAGAQVKRVGVVWVTTPSATDPLFEPFLSALTSLGYTPGRDIVVEQRWANGLAERIPALLQELLRLKVNVVIAPANRVVAEAKRLTAETPIVMMWAVNPVGSGFASSMARPGTNVTGVTIDVDPDIVGKALELLREVLPGLSRAAFLWNPTDPGLHVFHQAAEASAARLAIALRTVEIRSASDLDAAFGSIVRGKAEGVILLGGPLFVANRDRIAALAISHRLPTTSPLSDLARWGAMVAYGVNFAEGARRAAVYVDRLFRGAHAADLPIDQPTKFELVINLKTAKALGLTIPPSLLARADQVIE
jgi:putative ABC transport system substrate-binding protein